MPYVSATVKNRLNNGERPEAPGELTYLITMDLIEFGNGAKDVLYGLIQLQIERYLRLDKGIEPRYKDYAVVLGCLDSARREHVRRTGYAGRVAALALGDFQNRYYNEVVAPYEDKAIEKNGDVYV